MLFRSAVDFTAALARVGKVLGYRVTVCDARPVFATRTRFPGADEVVVDWPHRLLERVGSTLGPRDAVCVLTHDPKFDVPALSVALRTPAGYIGAMGSRRTHEDRLNRLKEAGVTDDEIARLKLEAMGVRIDTLTDEQLSVPQADAHGWSGRDLMAHLTFWLEVARDVARELAVNETSPAKRRSDEEWERRGDEWNDTVVAAWRELPMDEVRNRFRQVPGELRGYLTVVPESRWLKHPEHLRFFLTEMTDHYEAHGADLRAILAGTGR